LAQNIDRSLPASRPDLLDPHQKKSSFLQITKFGPMQPTTAIKQAHHPSSPSGPPILSILDIMMTSLVEKHKGQDEEHPSPQKEQNPPRTTTGSDSAV
jgi:hypothetical protein